MKLLRFFLPRIEYILLLAIFSGIAANGSRILNFDGDLPRHLLTGNLILQTGRVPTTDIFSFRTEGHPSLPHEWLSQAIFAAAFRALALDGVVLLTALVVMLTWGVVYRTALRRSESFFLALGFTALGVAASQIHVLPRPHIFTWLMTAIWLALLDKTIENKSNLWWTLPAVMLLWVNLHGMFVFGMFILGIYLFGSWLDQPDKTWLTSSKTRSLLAASGLSFLATFLSPSGLGIWKAIASLGSNAYITSRIPEYQAANFHQPETWPFLFLLLLTVAGFARAGAKSSWITILLVTAFTGLALYSSRMIPVFAVIVAPIGAKAASDWLHSDYFRSRAWTVEANVSRLNAISNGLIWIIAAVCLQAGLLRTGGTLDFAGQGNTFDAHFFPVEAVSWLEAHPQQGRMFNEFDWGGYLLLRLWPRQQIFMDGHTHIYGEQLTREYEQVINLSPGWEKVLGKYQVDWVIMRKDAPLLQALTRDPDWEPIYQDTTATILKHR